MKCRILSTEREGIGNAQNMVPMTSKELRSIANELTLTAVKKMVEAYRAEEAARSAIQAAEAAEAAEATAAEAATA